MSHWGTSAWENRAAANWIVSVHESLQPVTTIRDTLHLDVTEYAEEVRAAAAMLVLLIEAGRWPPSAVEPGLELAIARLQEICDKQLFDADPGSGAAIREEVRALRARLLRAPSRRSA